MQFDINILQLTCLLMSCKPERTTAYNPLFFFFNDSLTTEWYLLADKMLSLRWYVVYPQPEHIVCADP